MLTVILCFISVVFGWLMCAILTEGRNRCICMDCENERNNDLSHENI